MKPLSPTAQARICVVEDELYLNKFFDVACLCWWRIKIVGRTSMWVLQFALVFLVVGWVCYKFMTVRRVAHGEDYGLEFY